MQWRCNGDATAQQAPSRPHCCAVASHSLAPPCVCFCVFVASDKSFHVFGVDSSSLHTRHSAASHASQLFFRALPPPLPSSQVALRFVHAPTYCTPIRVRARRQRRRLTACERRPAIWTVCVCVKNDRQRQTDSRFSERFEIPSRRSGGRPELVLRFYR